MRSCSSSHGGGRGGTPRGSPRPSLSLHGPTPLHAHLSRPERVVHRKLSLVSRTGARRDPHIGRDGAPAPRPNSLPPPRSQDSAAAMLRTALRRLLSPVGTKSDAPVYSFRLYHERASRAPPAWRRAGPPLPHDNPGRSAPRPIPCTSRRSSTTTRSRATSAPSTRPTSTLAPASLVRRRVAMS